MVLGTGKQLTYVELEVDRYDVTVFEGVQETATPGRWTLRTGSNTTLVGVVELDAPSGRVVLLSKTSSDETVVWGWDVVEDVDDVSILALLLTPAAVSGIEQRVVARHTTGANFYALSLDGTNAHILKGESSLANVGFAFTVDTPVWVRFDVITIAGPEVLIRAKMWFGNLTDEPDLFMLSVQDNSSPIVANGAVGLGARIVGKNTICALFRARSLFGATTSTLRYTMPASYLPKEPFAIPNVRTVSVNPTLLSLGNDLGKRATIQIQFDDHRHADLGELFNSGTYWSKFRGRDIFRRGRQLRLIRQLLDDDETVETRHYVSESISGPNRDGSFTLVGHDLFKFADNDRSQAPVISNGFLQSAITSGDVAATLSPVGIGNLEYPASGHVAIGGEEICAFTRAGDVLTLTRAQFGTIAVAHSGEDRVQLCLNFTAQSPADIIHSLLTAYAGVDASSIPLATWQNECNTFLDRLYTRLIAEPTGIRQLISELIQQAGLVLWHDDITNLLQLQVLRGIPTNAWTYFDYHLLKDSVQIQEQPSTRLTQVWTYYGVRNPLESLTEPNNYRSTLQSIDTEGETNHGQSVIKKVFGTWIPAFGRTTADRTNLLLLGRFSKPPRRIEFAVQRYSGVLVPQLGSGYQFAWFTNQDEIGNEITTPIQVVQVNPMPDRYQVVAEEMFFNQFDPADLANRVIFVDSNVSQLNLRSLHDSIYPPITDDDIIAGVTLTVVVGAGVIINTGSTSAPALDVGSWPVGFTPILEFNGRAQGRGGDAGPAGVGTPMDDNHYATPGFPGGLAIFTRHNIDIEWGVGAEVFGGGGGGVSVTRQEDESVRVGGGGGAGNLVGLGRVGFQGTGANGTTEAGGEGAAVSVFEGGDGGDPGQPGTQATLLSFGFGTAGVAGAAIDGISFVNVVSGSADIRGPTIN